MTETDLLKSRNVKAYLKALAAADALNVAYCKQRDLVRLAERKLTGGQLGGAARLLRAFEADVKVRVRPRT